MRFYLFLSISTLPAGPQPAGPRDADGHADDGVAGRRRHPAPHAALPGRECAEGAPPVSHTLKPQTAACGVYSKARRCMRYLSARMRGCAPCMPAPLLPIISGGLQSRVLIHTSRSSVHGRCVLFFVHRAQAHLLATIFAVSFNQLSSVLHAALVIQ